MVACNSCGPFFGVIAEWGPETRNLARRETGEAFPQSNRTNGVGNTN